MKRLYFIRHDESELNAQHLLSGRIDTPLTENGRQQVHAVIDGVRSIGVDYILSSPLSRAYETASIIAEGIRLPPDKIHTSALLTERTYGHREGTAWDTTAPIADEPGSETLAAVRQRAEEALYIIKNLPFDTVLIVSHGTIWHALQAILNNQPSFEDTGAPDNAKIVQLI